DQTPDKDRHDHCHWMQADRISHNTGSVEYAFKILNHDENDCDPNGMPPIAPLKSGDENGWHPANDYPDVRDHCKDDNNYTNQGSKIEPEKRQCSTDEYAIHQTNKELTSKIRGDVFVYLRQYFRDFIL